MPTGQFSPVQMFPAQIAVPAAGGLIIGISVQSDGSASPEVVSSTVQDLVDLLQAWPGKILGADVTAQLYNTEQAQVTPTNPEPVPDPQPE